MPYEYGPYRKTSIKLNYNCPESEKSGTGKGSCSGSSGTKEESPAKVSKVATKAAVNAAKDQSKSFVSKWKDLPEENKKSLIKEIADTELNFNVFPDAMLTEEQEAKAEADFEGEFRKAMNDRISKMK